MFRWGSMESTIVNRNTCFYLTMIHHIRYYSTRSHLWKGENRSYERATKCPHRADAIWWRDAIFKFLKVHKRGPESKFWKPCEPGESRCFAAMKVWKILHQGQLCLLLQFEKSRPVCLTLRHNCPWCNIYDQNFIAAKHLDSRGSRGFQNLLSGPLLCTFKNLRIASRHQIASALWGPSFMVYTDRTLFGYATPFFSFKMISFPV